MAYRILFKNGRGVLLKNLKRTKWLFVQSDEKKKFLVLVGVSIVLQDIKTHFTF